MSQQFRRGFKLRSACLVFSISLLVMRAASAAEVYVLTSSDAAPYESCRDVLQKKLEKAGHTVHAAQLKDFGDKQEKEALADTKSCFVAVGSDAVIALHKRIPASHVLVYCMVADPQSLELAAGRQTIGIDTIVPLKAQFALIAEALPRTQSVGLLLASDSKEDQRLQQSVKDALPANWKLESIAVDKYSSVSKAVDALFDRKPDVIWTTPDSSLYDPSTVRSLLLASLRRKTPVFGYSAAFVRAGALLGVAVDPQTQGTQAADLLERVRTGKAGSNVPEAPQFDIAVNLIVADRISINLPDSLVQRASVVVRPH